MDYISTIKNKFLSKITTIPGVLQSANYPALTGLRGVAIALVLLYHLAINRLLHLFNWWLLGRVGVDIFFVLSGFLITTLLIKEQVNTGKISLKKFYIRRALRIIPVAYLFLVMMVIISHFFKLHLTARSFIAGFLFLKNFPLPGDYWTEHFWSLSVEEQFYLFFPLLLVININKTTIAAMLFVLVTLTLSLLGFYHVWIFYSVKSLYLFCRVAMFMFWEGGFAILIGSVFAILCFKQILPLPGLKQKYWLSTVLFAAAIFIHSNTFIFYVPYLSGFIFDILIGVIILQSIGSANLFNRLLTSRFFMWMGALSYSIYIWQQIFVWMHLPFLHEHQWGLNKSMLFIISDMIRLLFIISAACISYYFFELKFLKLKKHFA